MSELVLVVLRLCGGKQRRVTIWENVDDLAATVDVEMLAPFAANVDNNVEC